MNAKFFRKWKREWGLPSLKSLCFGSRLILLQHIIFFLIINNHVLAPASYSLLLLITV